MSDNFIRSNMPRIDAPKKFKSKAIVGNQEVIKQTQTSNLWSSVMNFFDQNKSITPQDIENEIEGYNFSIESYKRMQAAGKGLNLNILG